ncbi:cysteine hydrolase family protein [Halobacillus naozhouensis]|uniref:Cysteine hydrolase n=1 Tax=Halobacillus naozhouensis TaxID=554880 RepID=A0ABY8J135_9BACI|nr:isochorismatase family cysteine hydrolase [Halobacillus naozhouensis]WFT74601.1 cysteine hydrolase [Halobacillus naozhouensis]
MNRALIVIDYTIDFVAKEGALTCGEPGRNIEDSLVRLTEMFIKSEDYVVLAVDVHEESDPYHPETDLFPPHNIRGTEGRRLYGDLMSLFDDNRSSVYFMDKTRYSAFHATDLDMKLRDRGINEIHLAGVCTDICVLHTAVDAYNLGYQIVVHKDAAASFNKHGHEWALEHFKQVLGASVV